MESIGFSSIAIAQREGGARLRPTVMKAFLRYVDPQRGVVCLVKGTPCYTIAIVLPECHSGGAPLAMV